MEQENGDSSMKMDATDSSSSSSSSSLVVALQDSLVAHNTNFDARLKGEQLRLDLLFRWMRCSCISANVLRPDISMKWFDKLCTLHSESTRHYHTLMHLEEIFLLLDLHQQAQQQQQQQSSSILPILSALEEEAIVLATFFHDAIYNVHSSTNEEDSAALLEEFMRELTTVAASSHTNNATFGGNSHSHHHKLQSLVVSIILATKQHQIQQQQPVDDDPHYHCMALFLDLDMAVLGKDARAYQVYASLIRNEYRHVPQDVYCEKRAEILTAFLQEQPQIFLTQAMTLALEQRARDNLAAEIEMLQRGQIPNTNNSEEEE